jgi:hypothetical protein
MTTLLPLDEFVERANIAPIMSGAPLLEVRTTLLPDLPVAYDTITSVIIFPSQGLAFEVALKI